MNIKNRIKRIEKLFSHGGGICQCGANIELYKQDLTERTATAETVLIGQEIADFCGKCRKPIEKKTLIIQVCDMSSKKRFPELLAA